MTMRTLLTSLLFLLLLSLNNGWGADLGDVTPVNQTSQPQIDAAAELAKMQTILDKLKGQVSVATNQNLLPKLNDMTVELADNANTLMQQLLHQNQQIDTQLAVLGPAPATNSAVRETADVRQQRSHLENQQTRLGKQIQQAEALRNGASLLSAQILNLRRDQIKTQLALNTGSIFAPKFWQVLYNNPTDVPKGIDFIGELKNTIELSWQPGWRLATVLWGLTAIAVMVVGRRYVEEFLASVSIHKLPEGRLRRSFLAMATALTTLLAVVLAFNCLALAFSRHDQVPADVQELVGNLVRLSILSGLIAGLGRAFLSTRRASWRLPNISNEMALAMRSYPTWIAVLIFLFQALEAFNSAIGTSVSTTIFANGLTSLLIGWLTVSMVLRVQRVRRTLIKSEAGADEQSSRSTLAGLIDLGLLVTGTAILIALAIGYVAFARFLSFEVVWVGILFSSFFLLSHFFTDACEALFSNQNIPGRVLQRTLNLNDRLLHQLTSIFTAVIKSVLMILLILSLFNGTLGSSSPGDILQRIIGFIGGKGLERLHIVPSQVVFAIAMVFAGIYVLRSIRRWLNQDFLPKTTMDEGMRVSIVTLFSNIGYVLLILLTLSALGVQWNKLAWIVSALSVGIGFGLQEIVKNFISGLILLTERPVKVGDLIGISGIEGDIRRINVRATEIQLSDKSTMIVPNSQLISQNVRNATMGNAQGVVTIPLTFPLEIDPAQVRSILLEVFSDNERILDTPAPSVSFKELSAQGILLSVTGNVASQRQISSVKSELLFELLIKLRSAGIQLSSPQTMIIERAGNCDTLDNLGLDTKK